MHPRSAGLQQRPPDRVRALQMRLTLSTVHEVVINDPEPRPHRRDASTRWHAFLTIVPYIFNFLLFSKRGKLRYTRAIVGNACQSVPISVEVDAVEVDTSWLWLDPDTLVDTLAFPITCARLAYFQPRQRGS